MNDVPNVIILNVQGQPLVDGRATTRCCAPPTSEGDNMILIDWEVLAAECPGQCFATDGIHLDPRARSTTPT